MRRPDDNETWDRFRAVSMSYITTLYLGGTIGWIVAHDATYAIVAAVAVASFLFGLYCMLRAAGGRL